MLSRHARHGPADARVHAVNHMQDQRERGHQRAVLRQVRQQHRMVVLGPQPLLKPRPPAIEELLRRGIEAQERHLLSPTDHAAGQTLSGVASRVRFIVIGTFVHDQCGVVGVEERSPAAF
jgi:hypothetical protein